MEITRKVLEYTGITKHDVEKHIKNGTIAFDLESYIDSIIGGGNEFEDIAGMSKEAFIEKVNTTNKDTRDIAAGADLVIYEGKKYIIEYAV